MADKLQLKSTPFRTFEVPGRDGTIELIELVIVEHETDCDSAQARVEQ